MFETSSLPIGAYLITRGFKLLDARRDGPIVHFIFDDEAGEVSGEFYNPETLVHPGAYSTASRELARKMREVMRRG